VRALPLLRSRVHARGIDAPLYPRRIGFASNSIRRLNPRSRSSDCGRMSQGHEGDHIVYSRRYFMRMAGIVFNWTLTLLASTASLACESATVGDPEASGDPVDVPLEVVCLSESSVLPIVSVEVGGVAARMLVDTGSSLNCLSERFFETWSERGTSVVEADGFRTRISGRYAQLPAMEIAGFTIASQRGFVTEDLDQFGDSLGIRIDGVLGVPFFRSACVEIDYPRKRLRVHFRSPRQADSRRRGIRSAALNLRDGIPHVEVLISDEARLDCVLDTGFADSLDIDLDHPITSRIANLNSLPPESNSPEARNRRIGRLPYVMLGGTRFPSPFVAVTEVEPPRARKRAVLGSGFFRHCALIVDYRSREVAIRIDSGGTETPRRPGVWGLAVRVREGLLLVSTVIPDGPAHAAGVREGDRVLSVAGVSDVRSVAEFHSVLSRRDSAKLVLGRDQDPRVVNLERREYLPLAVIQSRSSN